MSSDSYTYTTISAAQGEPTRIGVSFYLDEHSRVQMLITDSGRPILSVTHDDTSATIAPRTASLTAADVAVAEKVADQAALYAKAVRQLRAGQQPGSAAA